MNEAAIDGATEGGTGDDTAAAVAAAAAAAEGGTGGEEDKTAAAIAAAAAGNDGSWRDGLSDDLKTSDALKNFKDVEGLAKSFVETKRMQGDSIRIPGEDAGEETRKEFMDKLVERVPELMLKPDFENEEQSAEFFRSLGMPETPEGYEIPAPEVEDGQEVEIDNDRIEVAKNAAHKLGVSNKQLKGILSAVMGFDIEREKASERSQSEELHGLHKEWGVAFEQNYSAALQVARATGAPDVLVEAIKSGKAGPSTLKWLHAMGKNMGGEGNNLLEQGSGHDTKMSPNEAQAKIDEIMANKKHPYFDATHPSHKAALDNMLELMDAKAGRVTVKQ